MKVPSLNRLSKASQLSLLSVVILLGAVFFTINSAMQTQNSASHASGGIVSGDVYTLTNKCSGQMMTVNDNSGSYVRILQMPSSNSSSQKWRVTQTSAGLYILQPLVSLEYLNVAGDSKLADAAIVEWPAPASSNDYFKLISISNGYYEIIGNDSGMAVELPFCTTSQATNLDQNNYRGASQQQWLLTDISSGTNVPTAVPTRIPTPTSAPTVKPTAAPTPQLTATPIPVPTTTPLPSQGPTAVPQPTDTPVPGATILNVTVGLQGIGTGGDSANPNSLGNMHPLRPSRTIAVDIYDAQNQLALSQQGTVNYNSSTGKFTGTVSLGQGFATGLYTVKIKTDQFLRAIVPGIQTITTGQATTLPTVTLVAGDINGDNQINIVDYNILVGCYSDLLPAVDCTPANNVLADLNDDGHVNQYDYNLFLRELTNIGGQ